MAGQEFGQLPRERYYILHPIFKEENFGNFHYSQLYIENYYKLGANLTDFCVLFSSI